MNSSIPTTCSQCQQGVPYWYCPNCLDYLCGECTEQGICRNCHKECVPVETDSGRIKPKRSRLQPNQDVTQAYQDAVCRGSFGGIVPNPIIIREPSLDEKSAIDVEPHLFAGIGLRGVNWLVDFLFFILIGSIIQGNRGTESEQETFVIFWWICLFLYYIVCEAAFQRTIGKLLTGTMVVRFDGTKPKVGQIILRTFCRFIPFNPISGLFHEHGLFWHDRISRTLVVKRKALLASEKQDADQDTDEKIIV